MKKNKFKKGFTILELVLAVIIIVILSSVTIVYFKGQITEIALESTSKVLVSDLNSAKQRAMSGDRGSVWGVRATVSNPSTWIVFASSSSQNINPYFGNVNILSPGLSWYEPSVGVREISFKPITGETLGGVLILSYGNKKIQIEVSSSSAILMKRL